MAAQKPTKDMRGYGSVVVRNEYREVEVPSGMIEGKKDCFSLEASRDGKIVPGILKGDKLIFEKTDKMEGDGFYLFEEQAETFDIAFFVKKSSDLLFYPRARLYKPEKYNIMGIYLGMIRFALLPTNETDG